VLLGADQDDRAEPLLRRARQTVEQVLGAESPTIATIDSDLSLIARDRGKLDESVALLRGAAGIQETALGSTHPELAATLYNLAGALRDTHDLAGALAAAQRCAAIRAKSLPRSDLYAFSLILQAGIENQLHRHEDALRDASLALEGPAPRADFQVTAWAQLERGRALVELHRDLDVARNMLETSRAAYAKNHLDQRVTEIDGLLARIR
jgi:tetratricopeptide (TPR) repeat protein